MKNKANRIGLSLLAWICVAGSVSDVKAVQNGLRDTLHRNVGAVGFYLGEPESSTPYGLCSGFVISDWAFVTAAHCIIAVPFAEGWAVTLEGGSMQEPALQPGVFTGGNIFDFPILAEVVPAADVFIHPDFDAGTLENDIAVLVFEAGTFTVAGVSLPEPGFLDSLAENGTLGLRPVGLVGYGSEGVADEGLLMPGYRQRGFCRASHLSANWMFTVSEFPFHAGTLPGDSGAPQFIGARAVSLTSAVAPFLRLDTPAILEFLRMFLD